MMHVVLVMLLIAGTGLLPVAESAAVCPPANVLYPCTCTTHNTLLGLRLNCGGKNLGDAALSKILDSVVYQNGVECQLNDFYANDNQLTVFPHQLRLCPRLGWVVLDNNNIRTIPAGAFHLRAVAGLPRPIFYFKIQFNGLKSVAPCAFLGISSFCHKNTNIKLNIISYKNKATIHNYFILTFSGDNYGDGTQLWLSYNSLTRFESGAYKSVLEQMFASGGRSFPNWDNSRPTGLTTFNMGAMCTTFIYIKI